MRSYYGSWEFSKFWRHFCLTSVGLLLPLHCLVLSLIIPLTCQWYKGAYASADFPLITLQIILWNSNARNSPSNFSVLKRGFFLHLPLSPCQPALSQTCSKNHFLLQQRRGSTSEFSVCTQSLVPLGLTHRLAEHQPRNLPGWGRGAGGCPAAVSAPALPKSKGRIQCCSFTSSFRKQLCTRSHIKKKKTANKDKQEKHSLSLDEVTLTKMWVWVEVAQK